MKRVLAVHYYFPPLGGIGSVRAVKVARYLPDFGWQPTVLTPRRGFYHQDRSLEDHRLAVERTPSLELSRGARRLGGRANHDLAPRALEGLPGYLQRFARRWLYRPDGQVGWYPFAVAAGRRLLRECRFRAIFSSSFPITAHLIALRLSADFGLPWLAEFRDPWTDGAQYDSAWRRRLDLGLESRILTTADGIATVSEGCADLLREHGARRVTILPNGFDPSDYPDAEGDPDNVVTYLGTYYPGRQDLDTALQALGRLLLEGGLGDLRVRIVSAPSQALDDATGRAGLAGRTDVTGFVPHREALALLVRSRLLLVAGMGEVGAQAPAAKGVIPAKVFEYLGARRPILYVGDPTAEVAHILRRGEGTAVVAAGDIEGAQRAIRALLRQPRPRLPEDLLRYTRRELARRLSQELDRIAP